MVDSFKSFFAIYKYIPTLVKKNPPISEYSLHFLFGYCIAMKSPEIPMYLKIERLKTATSLINVLRPSDAIYNICSGNGLLPDSINPLPEPMLTFH